jgi:ankyrin repeat protein
VLDGHHPTEVTHVSGRTFQLASRSTIAFALLAAVQPAVSAAGEPDLATAARNRDSAAVRALVKQQADVNTRLGDGTTALHWTVHWDDIETTRLLIGAGANVSAADDLGVTPLSLACTNGNAAMAAALLKAGADPNAARVSGETPLMTAARTGSAETVKLLAASGADVNAKEKTKRQTALMWAVAERHNDVVRVLLDHRADVQARSSSGFMPLLFASQQGDLEAARLLLAAGADVTATAEDGSDALLVAIDSAIEGLFEPGKADGRHQALAFYLLENGANPNAISAGRTPLHSAVWTLQTDLVKALLARGADPNARLKKRMPRVGRFLGGAFSVNAVGATPFWLAAHLADVPMMRLLVEHGADPLLTSEDGSTPLMMAVGLDNSEGWERHGIPWHGERAVLLSRYLDAAKYAVELGGDVNAVSKTGLTALHAAALVGGNDLVDFLVEHGANVNVKDSKGRTPLAVAEGIFSGVFLIHEETAARLKELGGTSDPER